MKDWSHFNSGQDGAWKQQHSIQDSIFRDVQGIRRLIENKEVHIYNNVTFPVNEIYGPMLDLWGPLR